MDPFNSRFVLSEKRWLWIDYDKGISIILVGYGHCFAILQGHGLNLSAFPFLNYFGVFMYGFRMPLFFIVSGLLVGRSLNKKGLRAYITDRTNNILYPLLIWGFIEITIKIMTARSAFHNDSTVFDYVNLIIDPRKTGIFWYLNALFCIGVIYSLLKSKLNLKATTQIIIGFVLFSISAYLHVNEINAGLLTDICQYYFFFALGDLISRTMFSEQSKKILTSWKLFIPLLAVFLFIQYNFTLINLRPNADGMNYVERKLPFFFLFEALIGCAISINFSFLLQRYKVFSFLRVVGFHSLFIYCMQIITMNFVRIIAMNLLKITYVPALVIIVWSLGIILPIFFYNFCLRFNLWWLYTFRKPERHIFFLRAKNIPLAG